MDQQTVKWLKISFIVYFFVILTMGFLAGYVYKMKKDNKSPFISDLKEMNDLNNANFTCSCISSAQKFMTFSFNENKVSNFNT